MPRRTKKVEEVIWGEVRQHKDADGIIRNHFFPNSRAHMNAVCSRFPWGKKLGMIPVEDDLSFSDSQRNYHFVLLGYIANETGNTKDDEHDDAMKEVFGIRTYINHKGETRESRHSISDASDLKLPDIQKLIVRDKAVCDFLGLVVPTAEELGYVSNNTGYMGAEKLKHYPDGPTETAF